MAQVIAVHYNYTVVILCPMDHNGVFPTLCVISYILGQGKPCICPPPAKKWKAKKRPAVRLCRPLKFAVSAPVIYIYMFPVSRFTKISTGTFIEQFDLQFQNFDSIPHVTRGEEGFYGGVVSLADYCPYIQEFTWRSQNIVIRGSHCQYPENNPRKLNSTYY